MCLCWAALPSRREALRPPLAQHTTALLVVVTFWPARPGPMANSSSALLSGEYNLEWLYPLELEYCVPADHDPDATFFSLTPWTSHVVQIYLIAAVSTLCNVGVLYVHWTAPPHPKFLLLPSRKLSIRMHVLSGSIEIFSSCVAWFLRIEAARSLVLVQVAASLVHSATALYQMPIVFGVQAIMIPAYACCVFLRLLSAVELALNPLCGMKVLRLYCVLSVYTWCRVFVLFFNVLNIFNAHNYSIAIALAGMCCLPAVGPAANVFCCLLVVMYGVWLLKCADGETRALQTSENSRDMFDDPRFQAIIDLNSRGASSCPFATASVDERRARLRALFDAIDTDKTGTIEPAELMHVAKTATNSAIWTHLMKHRGQMQRAALDAQQSTRAGLDFEAFVKFFVGRSTLFDNEQLDDVATTGDKADSEVKADVPAMTIAARGGGSRAFFWKRESLMRSRSRRLQKEVGQAGASRIVTLEEVLATKEFDVKAAFIFRAIDRDKTGTIDAQELGTLLLQYSLPFGDVEAVMRRCDTSRDGKISYGEFKDKFKGLINFQVQELKARHQEMQRDAARARRQQIYLQKQSSALNAQFRRGSGQGRNNPAQIAPAPATTAQVEQDARQTEEDLTQAGLEA